ncbi:MAG: dTDP-4-dehydrorhamnose 3,5-epimerase [Bacteroidales bacterium]|nr:dTDP-4-dehydrorhamnose 3,5-epimerase [Bacteroidales bacterium]MCL2133333.1 dTDP-4-dehydrorhamnose 3,5-epimerase [Bacteroidales bacterium]
MTFTETKIKGVWLIDPKVHSDDRGYFMESYKQSAFEAHIGKINFIQDNESKSTFGVLRGLHYQLPPFAQSKLVRAIAGTVLDVVVDIRKKSPTFGQYVAVELSADNKRQLFVPQGMAHGFLVLSPEAVFAYKVDNIYAPQAERSILYNDPSIGIDWGIPAAQIILSEKDKIAPLLKDVEI